MKFVTLCAVAIMGFGVMADTSAQVVITSSYVTAAGCPGGSHTGVPIVLCPGAGQSYVLGGNINASSTDNIDIVADNVTLDLNGFSVYGNAGTCSPSVSPPGNSCTGGAGSLFGINITGSNVTIKNGVVRSISGNGISAARNTFLKDLYVHDNRGFGVTGGENIVVTNVTATTNLSEGVYLQSGLIMGSSALYNNGNGLSIGTTVGGSITSSTAFFNSLAGVYIVNGTALNVVSNLNGSGIKVGVTGQVKDSAAIGNTGDGVTFASGAGGGVENTVAASNAGKGFNMSTASCYANISTYSNVGTGVSSGAVFASSICAH